MANNSASPTPVKKSNSTKVVIIVLGVIFLLITLFGAGGFLIYRYVKNKADQADFGQISQAVQDIEQYPETYKAAGLPQYPNGDIANLSKKNADVNDGISMVLTSPDSSTKVAEYYNQQLIAKGWAVEGEPTAFGESFYYRTYKKDGQEFSLTVQGQDNETTATITWNVAQ